MQLLTEVYHAIYEGHWGGGHASQHVRNDFEQARQLIVCSNWCLCP
jgi:hypothetical protein